MNILIKLPLVLSENIVFGLVPGFREVIENNIYNPFFFGDKYIEYTKSQYKSLRKNIPGLDGKTMLELGPGGSVGLGLLSLRDGLKKYIAIDNENHLNDKKTVPMYQSLLGAKAILSKLMKKVEVMPLNKEFGYDLKNESVDIIYSCAVLEHVKDLESCFLEMTRVLKKGGLMNHQVDLRDHVFSQKNLSFLLIPSKIFDFLFGNTDCWVNRSRWSNYKKIFHKNGLKVKKVYFDHKFEGKIPYGLSKRMSREDIINLSFNVLLQKI